MKPTTILALLLGFCAAGVLAGPTIAVPDPYDPAALNESAMDAVRQGDLATARILLQRAARVAPYDARIERNLRALDAHRAGATAPGEPAAAKAPPARQEQVPAIPPEPPAIWPPKQ